MTEVDVLLGPRKQVAAIAQEMRTPYATVWSWKKSGSIPDWRRPYVLDAVRRLKLDLPAEVIAYLARAA